MGGARKVKASPRGQCTVQQHSTVQLQLTSKLDPYPVIIYGLAEQGVVGGQVYSWQPEDWETQKTYKDDSHKKKEHKEARRNPTKCEIL